MAECNFTYTDTSSGKIIDFQTENDMFDFLQNKKLNKNIEDFVDSLDSLKDSKLIKSFENIQLFLSASYKLEWFNNLRRKFPELKETSSRLSSLNKQALDLNLKQAQSIVAFIQSGISASEAVKSHFKETSEEYKDNPLAIYNELSDSNNFALAYLEVVKELKDYFTSENIDRNNDVFNALIQLEENLRYINLNYNKLSQDHVVDSLWEVFKNMDISGNHIDIVKQIDDINNELLEAEKNKDAQRVETLNQLLKDLENSHPEIEARKARLKSRLEQAKAANDQEVIEVYQKEINKLDSKKISKELIRRTLFGENQDLGWLTSYLEAAGMSGDSVISGMQLMLNKHQRNVRKNSIIIQNKLDTFQQNLFKIIGTNKNNLKESYKDLYQWVTIKDYDDEGNVTEQKRLTLNTEFDWEFINVHNELKNKYRSARKAIETTGDVKETEAAFKALKKWERENLELSGNSDFYEILDNLSHEAREALDDVNSEIYLFDHLHRNQINLTIDDWRDYKLLQLKKASLYSQYDMNTGELKKGKDLEIANELSRYKKATSELYEYLDTPEGEKVWEKNRNNFENFLNVRLKDGLITDEEYEFQMSIWHQRNSIAQYSKEFYDKRSALYKRLEELTGKNEEDSKLREDLSRIKGGSLTRDDQNQTVGTLYTTAQVSKIKELQEQLEVNRQTKGEITLKDKIEYAKLLEKYDLVGYFAEEIREIIKTDANIVDEDRNLITKVLDRVFTPSNSEVLEIFDELSKLQETVNTTYYEALYEDKYNEIYYNTDRLDNESDKDFNKRVLNNFKQTDWFQNNHYLKINYDKAKKRHIHDYVPLSIWTVTEPRNKEDIFNAPSFKYSKTREIKSQFKNLNSKYDEILKTFLPKLSKWKNKSYPSNPDTIKVLSDLTNYYLDQQQKTTTPNRLGYFFGGKEQELNEALLNSGTYKEKLQKTWSFTKNRFKFAASDKDNGYGLADLQGNPFQYVPIKYNTVLDENDQSYDIFGTIMGYLYDVEQTSELQKAYPTFKAIVKILEDNTPYTDKKNALANTLGISRYIKGDTNLRHKQAESIMLTQMYKEYKKKGENRVLSKAIDNLNGFAAFASLTYNIPSSVVNWMSARVQISIESISNEYFNYKIWKYGELEYLKYAKDFMTDYMKAGNKSFISQLTDYFDPLTGEYSEGVEEGFKRTAFREFIQNQPGNYLRTIGEHEVQISTMLGILKSNIVFYKDKHMSLLDAYSQLFNDNKNFDIENADLYFATQDKGQFAKGKKFTKDDELRLINRIQGINVQLHGNYSKLNQSMAERYALGRLAFFFRKYFVPMFARRFASLRSNVMLDNYTEGYYRTFYNRVLKDLYNVITRKSTAIGPKNWYNNNTDLEKANLKRFAGELLIILSLNALMALTAGLFGDDDGTLTDETNPFVLYSTYLMKRVKSETEQFIPIPSLGFDEIGKTLMTPSMSGKMHFRNTLSLTRHTWQLVNGDDSAYFKRDSGIWDKGDPKLTADLLRLIGFTGKSFYPNDLIKSFDFAQKQL